MGVSLDVEQAAKEAEAQIQLQLIQHEYEEALLRAQQLLDLARYEQEFARAAAQEITIHQEAHDQAMEADRMADLMIQEAIAQMEDLVGKEAEEEPDLDVEAVELQSERT